MEETFEFGIFANDLVYYVATNLGYECYDVKNAKLLKKPIKSSFDENIGNAIIEIVNENDDFIHEVSEDLRQCINNEMDIAQETRRYALLAVPEYFPDGYTHIHFLAYCSLLLGVAVNVNEKQISGDMNIFEAVKDTIASVLTSFSLTSELQTSNGLEELIEISMHICFVLFYKNELKLEAKVL